MGAEDGAMTADPGYHDINGGSGLDGNNANIIYRKYLVCGLPSAHAFGVGSLRSNDLRFLHVESPLY